jgi:hypothetical protein
MPLLFDANEKPFHDYATKTDWKMTAKERFAKNSLSGQIVPLTFLLFLENALCMNVCMYACMHA